MKKDVPILLRPSLNDLVASYCHSRAGLAPVPGAGFHDSFISDVSGHPVYIQCRRHSEGHCRFRPRRFRDGLPLAPDDSLFAFALNIKSINLFVDYFLTTFGQHTPPRTWPVAHGPGTGIPSSTMTMSTIHLQLTTTTFQILFINEFHITLHVYFETDNFPGLSSFDGANGFCNVDWRLPVRMLLATSLRFCSVPLCSSLFSDFFSKGP